MIRHLRAQADYQDLNITTRLLIDVALKRCYDVTYCPASAQGETGLVICRKKPLEIRFKSDATDLSPVYGYYTALDKVLAANLLEEAGVETPTGYECSSYKEIAGQLDFITHRYVVKPTSMNHGDGVSTNLATPKAVEEAIERAKKISHATTVIVQEQVAGDEFRFLVLNDKVIAVAGRRQASVVGDGMMNIRQLVDRKNNEEDRGDGHLSPRTRINPDDVAAQFGSDMLSRVPKKGEIVFVTQTSNLSKGGDAVDYTSEAHARLRRLAVNAAKACSLGLAGVDIMTDSINAPSEAYVIEVNIEPGLRMHHFPAASAPRDVASMIFSALEEKARKGQTLIPVSSYVDFRTYKNMKHIPARIDTGARTSALWATNILVEGETVHFSFFGKGSPFYTGKRVSLPIAGVRTVTSSMGHVDERCVVVLPIILHGRKMNAKFTLANRSKQMYPILIGRNTLRGTFLVDSGDPGLAAFYKDPAEKHEYKEVELAT